MAHLARPAGTPIERKAAPFGGLASSMHEGTIGPGKQPGKGPAGCRFFALGTQLAPEHPWHLPGRNPSTTQTYGGDLSYKFCIFAFMGRHILFKCPRLGTNVQHWLPDAPPADEQGSNSYASVVCLACSRLHFIHKETGKLLGEN